jgi:glutamate synthase domain-containing protein 3
MKKLYNGEIMDMSSEEETEHNQHLAELQTKYNDEATAKTNLENLKASAKAKLVAGTPLTEEEANTIVL